MWDAREPSLENQFIDATEFHGQGGTPDTSAHPNDSALGAAFQQGSFSAQVADFTAGDLTGADGSGALGGPENLYESRLNVINPPIPFSPGFCFDGGGPEFCPGIFGIPNVFDLYTAFANATTGKAALVAKRQSIARGENVFNTRSFV